MRRTLKFLHTLGAIGLTGALAAQIVLLSRLPAPGSLAEYAALRGAMGALAEWILLPSLGITLVSGLLAMSMTHAFHNAGWAWLKLALGVSMFEGTLITVQGPAQKEAELSARALAGDLDPRCSDRRCRRSGIRSGSCWRLPLSMSCSGYGARGSSAGDKPQPEPSAASRSVLRQPAVQGAAGDAQYRGGALLVALRTSQHPAGVAQLQNVQRWQVIQQALCDITVPAG